MASEATDRAPEGGSDVRQGPPLEVPDGSLGQWFIDRAERYADLPAVLVKEDGEYGERSYEAFHQEARQVAGGFMELGLEPGDRVAIQSGTRYEWSVADVATLLSGTVVVPVYPTFSPSQAAYVIDDAGADVLLTEPEDVADEGADVVDEVIHIADLPTAEPEELPGTERDDEDLATMIYTSGTTGDPKGVQLTHRNIRAELTMLRDTLPQFPPGKRGSCFLPLSHIYQRATNWLLWDQGHAAVFMSPDTLLEDLQATEPHILGTVPRVYRRMYDGLNDQVAGMGTPKAQLVEWAMGVAREYGAAIEDGGPGLTAGLRARHAIADRLVFSTLREEFGLANVEYAITGAASLDAGLLRFFWGMGVPLLEVYGATETTGGATFNRMDSFRSGTVGKPLPGVSIQLAHDGEVLIKGPNVMPGYWNLPEATEESLDDGWYRTGDIGRWNGEFLEIIDRKKHMQVLDTGKNVYSDPIEEVLRRQPHIAEALIVAEERKFVSALIQPNFSAVLSFADKEGIDYDEGAVERDGDEVVAVPADLLDHPDVEALFDEDVATANEELAEYERVKKFRLIERALSVEREELTPTLKKRRGTIQENFADRIEAMYPEADTEA